MQDLLKPWFPQEEPMRCTKCGSTNIVVATAPNGFGTWMCHGCGHSGSYPPQEACEKEKK